MAMFIKKEVCPTCNGEKTILCCSCGVDSDDECSTLVCPSCQGTGELKSYNTPAIIGAVVAALVVVLVIFFAA